MYKVCEIQKAIIIIFVWMCGSMYNILPHVFPHVNV